MPNASQMAKWNRTSGRMHYNSIYFISNFVNKCKVRVYSLEVDGPRVVRDNTALVVATENLAEAVLTPPAAPGVLDDPIVTALLTSVADKRDDVIDLLRAAGVVVDTSTEQLEVPVLTRDRDDHGSVLGNGLSQSLLVTGADSAVLQSLTVGATLLLAGVVALSAAGLVGVVALGDETARSNVIHDNDLVTTIASTVHLAIDMVRAIDDLLFSKIHELTSLLGNSRLDDTNSTERVARSARRLVL